MEQIIAWLELNKEWIFSGFGVVIVTTIGKILFFKKPQDIQPLVSAIKTDTKDSHDVNIHIENSIEKIDNSKESTNTNDTKKKYETVKEAQDNIKILFIDDDTKFKVINILKRSGWLHTKILKDINDLDSDEVQKTDIFFIDIQGVGKKLSFQDEGLGLADALKKKYENKKVIIYSAETRGDRFHEALRNADDFLPKNAEPFQFQQTIERFFVN